MASASASAPAGLSFLQGRSERTPGVRTLWLITMLSLVGLCTLVSTTSSAGETLTGVPVVAPGVGVAAGLYLTTSHRLRNQVLVAITAITVAASLAGGMDLTIAIGFAITNTVTVAAVRALLLFRRNGRRAALNDTGDVSRLIAAITVASLISGLGFGMTDVLAGAGDPRLGALAGFGTHAAAMMVLLPLFLQTVRFPALASPVERIGQGVLTLATTVAVFAWTDVPPVVFAVMPMFAWHAFRGSLREATLLLTAVGVIGTGFTLAGVGPIYGLTQHYGVPHEIVIAIFQLFLVDCGMILLPLSVMTTQHRIAAARADAERTTLQRLITAATGTAIVATGPDGRIQLANPGAEAMFGYPAARLVGKLPDDLFDPTELNRQADELGTTPHFWGLCRSWLQLDGGQSRVWHLVGGDGKERDLRITLSEISDPSGTAPGYLITADDVTEREAAHQALMSSLESQRVAMDRLSELERVKADFVSTVSHELRTPITSIIGYTELLDDDEAGTLTPSQRDIVERVDRNGRRLLLLVQDLLTLSQIESSQLSIEPAPYDATEVVRRARIACEPMVQSRRLDVAVDVPDGAVELVGDARQLERMVVHLFTNAIKFTPDGGEVAMRLNATPSGFDLLVADTGFGIPECEQERLFQRFFRSSVAAERAIPGTGLGLTIVREIVALHGGEITITSAPGEGTTVLVRLPREIPEAITGKRADDQVATPA